MTSVPSTIPAVVQRAAEDFGDDEALVDGDRRWSFAELSDEAHQTARALIASGVEPGERVAIWAPNLAEWAMTALAIHSVGAVLVPINTRFKGTEATYLLERASVRHLFTVSDFLDIDYVELLRSAGDGELPSVLSEIVVLTGAAPAGTTSFEDFRSRSVDATDAAVAERTAALTGDSVCNILFTSGTTGRPKGAMLTHGATTRAFDAWASIVGLRRGDRYLIVNPFFHSFGLNAGILACMITGATMVPHPVFDVGQIMERVVAEKISMIPGPPAIYQTILNHPELDSFDMSSLRLAVTGAAPVPVPMILEMRERLGFETILTAYGLTEATGIATVCRHDDAPEIISGTSGRAIEDVEVAIVDDDGSEVPRGTPGEIVVRGYNIMLGYLDDPEATSEAIDADGWLHTGDIGVMDDGGNVDITDRKKDMFIRGGENCYPAEIEDLLLGHPDIAQVAVIGVPDERMGEVGMAFVVPAAGSDPDPDAIIGWAREHMANYKVPRRVEVLDALPLNASNKVLKYELRERFVD